MAADPFAVFGGSFVPSLTLGSSAATSSAANSQFGGGAWSVNVAGSGTANQTAAASGAGSGLDLKLIALAVGALWLLKR